MDDLQYFEVEETEESFQETKVLNLVINGWPSIRM